MSCTNQKDLDQTRLFRVRRTADDPWLSASAWATCFAGMRFLR
jgi:hypothetical protein